MTDPIDNDDKPKRQKSVRLSDLKRDAAKRDTAKGRLEKAPDALAAKRALDAAAFPFVGRALEIQNSSAVRGIMDTLQSSPFNVALQKIQMPEVQRTLNSFQSPEYLRLMDAHRQQAENISNKLAAAPIEQLYESVRRITEAANRQIGGLSTGILANVVPPNPFAAMQEHVRSHIAEMQTAAERAVEAARLPTEATSMMTAIAGIRHSLIESSQLAAYKKFAETGYLDGLGKVEQFSSIVETMRRQQEGLTGPTSAIGRILKQMEEQRDRWASLTNVGIAGALIASLASAGINSPSKSSLADAAWVVAEARRTVANDELWREAKERSVLVEGVAALSTDETEPGTAIRGILDALERHAERLEAMFAQSSTPSRRLFHYDYVVLIVSMVSMLATLFAIYQTEVNTTAEEAKHDYGPDIVERLDRLISAPLHEAAEKSATQIAGMPFVVCTAKTRAFVRQAPTTESKAVGAMRPGDKAAIVSETENWIEVEYVDALSGEAVRGWVYRRLLAKLTIPPT
ncbi:SH3 domain-containing protein [Inquilinus sp. OTU3971]|uniref:SH3 domain-containing protein n=1 Tax=Inquilinus sp. OTU3971 TaxID=3043855 RepID=UPI00313BD847